MQRYLASSKPNNLATVQLLARRIAASKVALCLGAIFLLGLGLRLYCLDCYSLWYDEVMVIESVEGGLPAVFSFRTFLYYFMIWWPVQLVDPTTTSVLLRLPSALAGSLMPIVVYGLGCEVFGRIQGLLAALFAALSTVLINYSQEARTYAVLPFLTALTVYCLLVGMRTRLWKWWLAALISTVANVLYSLVTLTFILPTLAPFVIWLFWSLWLDKGKKRGRLVIALVALALGMAGFVWVVLGFGRALPDLSSFSVSTFTGIVLAQLAFHMQFGIGGQWQSILHLCLLLLAAYGGYVGIRRGNKVGVYLCVLFILLPPLLLALSGTTNTIRSRYALFSITFYFLLIANALHSIVSGAYATRVQRVSSYLYQVYTTTLLAALLLVFIYGAYYYHSPNGYSLRPDRSDLRGAARYLSQNARPSDLILYVGPHPVESNFYWKGKPPAPTYSILDPRIFRASVSGSIFYVTSYIGTPPEEAQRDPKWEDVLYLDGVVLLRERAPNGGVIESVEWFVQQFENAHLGNHELVLVFRGSLYQARGDVPQAAAMYEKAGALQSIGGGLLGQSKQYAAKGSKARAWRDAILSKNMEPRSPELHRWMAQLLAEMGYPDEGQTELRLADALDVDR